MKIRKLIMSVSDHKAMRSTEITGAGIWEFDPSLTPVKSNKNNNNYNRLDRKVNLKRGKNFTSRKTHGMPNSRDPGAKYVGSLESRKNEKKKLRNAKELESCLMARSHSASPVREVQKEMCQAMTRTRSMSPTPSTPPLNSDLPLRKFYSYMAKISEQFEIVKIFVSHQSEEGDSLQEINRQRKRATEFAVRFSRNNLYQMKRLVNDIKQIIVPYPFENLAKSDSEILCKKILLAYQSATQSLQTYINYMKSGQSLDVPEKTRELILLILDLYLCCEHISLPSEQIDLLSSCKELIVLLDMKIAEEKRKTTALRPSEKLKESQKEDRRFSMYKTKLTNSNWKKKTEALAKIKFGLPKLSQLKRMKKKEENPVVPRSTFEIYTQRLQDTCHRKVSKTDIDDRPKQVLAEKGTKKSHATPREVTSQDDDIETVVQSIDNEESLASNRIPGEESDSSLGHTRDYINKNNVRDLVMQTIQEMQHSEKHDVENTLKNLLKSLNCQSNPLPHRNVKLIHIISTDPIPEEPEEEQREEEETKLQAETVAAAQNPIPEFRRRNLFESIIGDEVVRRGRAVTVSEESCNIAIKYKKMLNEYRRNNIMYKKGMPVRPCELVLRISDQIINEILVEISSGMGNENLLTQLYSNEFLETI